MINFEKQFDNIESRFKDIENKLNNQTNLDTEKLIQLNNFWLKLPFAFLLLVSVHSHPNAFYVGEYFQELSPQAHRH